MAYTREAKQSSSCPRRTWRQNSRVRHLPLRFLGGHAVSSLEKLDEGEKAESSEEANEEEADNEESKGTTERIRYDADQSVFIGSTRRPHHGSAAKPGGDDRRAADPDRHPTTGDDEIGSRARSFGCDGPDDEHHHQVDAYADEDRFLCAQSMVPALVGAHDDGVRYRRPMDRRRACGRASAVISHVDESPALGFCGRFIREAFVGTIARQASVCSSDEFGPRVISIQNIVPEVLPLDPSSAPLGHASPRARGRRGTCQRQ